MEGRKIQKLRFRNVHTTSYELGSCFVGIVIVFSDGKVQLVDGKQYPTHSQSFLELDLS